MHDDDSYRRHIYICVDIYTSRCDLMILLLDLSQTRLGRLERAVRDPTTGPAGGRSLPGTVPHSAWDDPGNPLATSDVIHAPHFPSHLTRWLFISHCSLIDNKLVFNEALDDSTCRITMSYDPWEYHRLLMSAVFVV